MTAYSPTKLDLNLEAEITGRSANITANYSRSLIYEVHDVMGSNLFLIIFYFIIYVISNSVMKITEL